MAWPQDERVPRMDWLCSGQCINTRIIAPQFHRCIIMLIAIKLILVNEFMTHSESLKVHGTVTARFMSSGVQVCVIFSSSG